MNVLQQAQLYVDQLRREAGKTRINVSDSIHEMKVGFRTFQFINNSTETLSSSGICDSDPRRGLSGYWVQLPQTKSFQREGFLLSGLGNKRKNNEETVYYFINGNSYVCIVL